MCVGGGVCGGVGGGGGGGGGVCVCVEGCGCVCDVCVDGMWVGVCGWDVGVLGRCMHHNDVCVGRQCKSCV